MQGMMGFTTLRGLKTVSTDTSTAGVTFTEPLRSTLREVGLTVKEKLPDAQAHVLLRVTACAPGWSIIHLFVFQPAKLDRRPDRSELVDTYRLMSPEIDTHVPGAVKAILEQFKSDFRKANAVEREAVEPVVPKR